MQPNRALAAGLATIVLWASAFAAIRVAAPELGVVGLSFVRLAVATIALLVAAPFLGVRLPRREDLGWIAACGLFGMAAYQLLLNEAERHVPAATASIIVAAAPLVSVAVARLLFREPVNAWVVAGSAVAFSGVAVVCLARDDISLSTAALTAVGAMVVQGIFHPLQRPLLTTYRGIEVATYAMVAGAAMTLPFVPFGWSGLVHASAAGWMAAVYLGVGPSALGFVLWAHAVRRLPIASVTSLLYLAPPIAVLIAWLWLGEVPTMVELVGGVIVIVGVVVVSSANRRRLPLGSGSGSGRVDTEQFSVQ